MKFFIATLVLLTAGSSIASTCNLKMYSDGDYYISNDSSRVSNYTSSLDTALDKMYELNSYGVCNLPLPQNSCKITMYSDGDYYVTINGSRYSKYSSSLISIAKTKNKLIDNGICFQQIPSHQCKMNMYSDGYFYVTVDGGRKSRYFETSSEAYKMSLALASKGVCTMGSVSTVPRRGARYDDILGFNFKSRALMIATVVVNVSKVIEPSLTNVEEKKIDAIKKQAVRLRARINGRRNIKIVRNTLLHLGTLLDDSAHFIDRQLETDRYDTLSEQYILAYESIQSMVNFLDNDFNGKGTGLY